MVGCVEYIQSIAVEGRLYKILSCAVLYFDLLTNLVVPLKSASAKWKITQRDIEWLVQYKQVFISVTSCIHMIHIIHKGKETTSR